MLHLCRTLLRLLSKDLHRIGRTLAAAPYTDASINPSSFPRMLCRTRGECELVGFNRQRWPNCVSWMVGGRRRPQVQWSMRSASASARRHAAPCLCIALLVSTACAPREVLLPHSGLPSSMTAANWTVTTRSWLSPCHVAGGISSRDGPCSRSTNAIWGRAACGAEAAIG